MAVVREEGWLRKMFCGWQKGVVASSREMLTLSAPTLRMDFQPAPKHTHNLSATHKHAHTRISLTLLPLD